MRSHGRVAMQVGSIKSMLGLVLGLVASLLITSVGISKAKPAGGPTVENAFGSGKGNRTGDAK